MIKKTVLLFVAACSLLHAFAQTTPISNAELEARGTWIFWPYKSINDGSGCTVESTLMFANGNSTARFADSISYFPMYGSSSSTPTPSCDSFDFCDLVNQDYIKGVLLVFGWNYLQYKQNDLDSLPTYGTNGNDLIQYQKFYEAIKAVVNTDNIKGYGIEIWTGNWAPIGDPLNPDFPFWLLNAGVKRIIVTKGTITNPENRFFPDYLDKGRKVANSYINNIEGVYPDYVEMPGVTSAQTSDGVYKDDDYSLFGYTSDNFAETNYEYYYRNFLYRVIQYLCNLKTTGTPDNNWEDIATSKKIKEKLLFLQCAEGSTGDTRPWTDGYAVFEESTSESLKIDVSDDIDLETEWPIFVRKHWGWLANTLYKLNGAATADPSTRPLPNVHLLLNGGNGTKVWGERSDNSNPGLNKLPRKVTIDFTQPSLESYLLWPIANEAVYNNGVYNNNADRLTRNWYRRRYNGSTWNNTPDAIIKYLYQSWRKPPEGGHLYNMNFGRQYRDMYRRMKYDQLGNIAKATMGSNGGVIRYRDECDWANNDLDKYLPRDNDDTYNTEKLLRRPQHLFASATSALDFGLDYWIQYYGMVSYVSETGCTYLDTANAKVFTFFNQHVQDYDYSNNDITKSPMSSYLAFKDGLDAADTTRFAVEDFAIHGGNNNKKQKVNSTNDDGTVNGTYNGEKYCEKIATNRNLGLSNIYNQNSVQAVSDIAQGGTGNQYNSNGAGKNDVGWFVTTDNDAAIIKSGSSTKLTMWEVNDPTIEPTVDYREKQIGYYNILGTTNTGTIDKSSPFGRFSKGVVSTDMANSSSSAFYNKANSIYIKLSDEIKAQLQNDNAYFAITWFGSSGYNGGVDAVESKLGFGLMGAYLSGGELFDRFDVTNTNTSTRKRWFTKVFSTCAYTPAASNAPWDIIIFNGSESPATDVSIQVATVEVFIGSKPDYYTDNSADTKSYYAYPAPYSSASNTDPFADENISTISFSTSCIIPPWCYPNCDPIEEQYYRDPITTNRSKSNWEIYPNPAVNHATIRINQSAAKIGITIRDMMGKTLQSKSLSNIAAGSTIPIDLSGYAKGVYAVTLQIDGITGHKKLVIE